MVKLPANPDAGAFDPTGVKVLLRDAHGTTRSSVDMATATATPCLFYRADGTIGGRGGCSANP